MSEMGALLVAIWPRANAGFAATPRSKGAFLLAVIIIAHIAHSLLAPSLRGSEAQTGFVAFRKTDLDVYRSGGLYAPVLCARSRLRKVDHLQL